MQIKFVQGKTNSKKIWRTVVVREQVPVPRPRNTIEPQVQALLLRQRLADEHHGHSRELEVLRDPDPLVATDEDVLPARVRVRHDRFHEAFLEDGLLQVLVLFHGEASRVVVRKVQGVRGDVKNAEPAEAFPALRNFDFPVRRRGDGGFAAHGHSVESEAGCSVLDS